jgi:hypothetical protein
MDDDTPTPRCANPACGDPFLPEQDGQKYCATRCREAAKKRRQRFRLRRGKGGGELLDPQGTSVTRDDPRQYSDYDDLPDDFDLAAEIDHEDQDDEQAARFHEMVQEDEDQRTPRETWKRWRSHGRRHGVEHPEATADRIDRHHAAEAARMARIDRSTGGRIQDRFDTRTSANVAQNAIQSRALNARHTEQPPVSSPAFDFTAEQVTGDFYRGGRPTGQRSSHGDYAWDLGTTGFIA